MLFDEKSVCRDPFAQFELWFEQATAAGLSMVNAMALATATPSGVPSVRMVLLKGFDERGFVFFTNYESRKGRELAVNPNAALCLFWEPLGRQVRITGGVEETSADDSDAYFATRPLGSRIGAAASPQSSVIPDRTALESAVAGVRAAYPDGNVPRPSTWGGFRVLPRDIEFWQSREDRLHDRILYTRAGGGWRIERLAP